MRILRVLITNSRLENYAGSEVTVRDLACELKRQGHEPIVFSPRLGTIASEIQRYGVQVQDDLRNFVRHPDVIHGHHHPQTLAALLHFSCVPAVFSCLAADYHVEEPFYFPRIMRYVALDERCRRRIANVSEIPADRTEVILNAVDLERFNSCRQLPSRARRALVFSNYASCATHLPVVRKACRRAGLELHGIGMGTGNAAANPESILPKYDIVFAKASCALQAMAAGNAVILCDSPGAGPMVTSDKLEYLRRMNFGAGTLTNPLQAEYIEAEIARYDAEDAARVTARIRNQAGLTETVQRWTALYSSVIAEFNALPQDFHQELRAIANYAARWSYSKRVDWEKEQLAKLRSFPLIGGKLVQLARRMLWKRVEG